MRREQKRFDEGEGTFRLVNKVFSDPVDQNETLRMRQVKFEFVRILADQQDLLKCGMEEYDTLRIYHDGICWIAESQAKVYGK
jgi:hypothetical protein